MVCKIFFGSFNLSRFVGLGFGQLGRYSDATKDLGVFESHISSTKHLILQGILSFHD
jgi:hypothetical protein